METKPRDYRTKEVGQAASALSKGRRILPAAVGALAILATAGGTYAYWHYTTVHPSTDNAYLRAGVVQVAPAVSGRIDDVIVKSFSHVKAGDELLRIDLPRFEAALSAAEARLKATEQQRAGAVEARAAVEQARSDLENATVKAPVDGTVGNVTVRPGSMARAGAVLFPIVDGATWWVDANFKETDLGRIREGQKATVRLDIYQGQEFAGKVEAVGPASTSAFSLLPNENATGNWIKLTQRFPVRISLSLKPGDPDMRFGASATVTVDTTDQGSR